MERYTLGYDAAALAFVSRRTLESHGAFFIPHLRPGMQVVDVGCGPGSMTVGIAAHIGSGRAIGVDMGESQVRLATQRAAEQGVANAEFRVGSAYDLPFADAQFDALFSHALLEHLREPVRAMREFLRVLKPGGVMGVVTPDWSGFLVGPLKPRGGCGNRCIQGAAGRQRRRCGYRPQAVAVCRRRGLRTRNHAGALRELSSR